MENREYITVSEYASIKGISKQAVYKQLNNRLKNFLIVVENQKCLKLSILNEVEKQRLNNPKQPEKQPFEQPLNNENQPLNNPYTTLLEHQIEEKDKTIERLLAQIENLQTQNSKLTDLLQNSQVLLAAEKKLYLEERTKTIQEEQTEQPKEEEKDTEEVPQGKKGIFGRRNKKKDRKKIKEKKKEKKEKKVLKKNK